VAPDGQRILALVPAQVAGDNASLTVVINWDAKPKPWRIQRLRTEYANLRWPWRETVLPRRSLSTDYWSMKFHECLPAILGGWRQPGISSPVGLVPTNANWETLLRAGWGPVRDHRICIFEHWWDQNAQSPLNFPHTCQMACS